MYPPIRKEMSLYPSDIRNPPNKARAKRDTQPLARGSFPDSEKGLPVQALSDCLHFNQPCQVDSGVEKLLPSKKNTFSIQGRFSEENLRKMERDLKVSLSSLSYVTWSMDFATQYLIRLSEKKKKKRDTYLPVVSALKHALSFLTSVVDRSSTTLATTILARRDSYLSQMDDIIPEEDLISLRSADFMDHRLFAGTIADIVPKLDSLRKDNQSRESVDALASLAKKGVGSAAKPSSSGTTASKKKNSKKFSKQKKTSNQNVSSSGGNNSKTTTEPSKPSGITRTFRPKGKKSGKK